MLQTACSESMKTRTHISDVDSRLKVGTFEVVLEVYQLPYWVYELTLPAGLVETFDKVCWRTHQRYNI